MKIVVYGEDGAEAKAYVTELRANKVPCRLIHALACNEREPCDGIEFLRDVSAFDRARLEALFGIRGEVCGAKHLPKAAVKAEARSPAAPSGLSVGKGPGGRFYVKHGKEIISGPYATEGEASAAMAREA